MSILIALGSFLFKNWRVCLPLVLAGMLYGYIHHLQSQRDTARHDYETLLQAVQQTETALQQEQQIKDAQSALAIAQVNANHQSEIETLRREDAIKHKQDMDAAARTIDQWRERVRLEVARNSDTVAMLSSPTEQLAGGGSDCDATVAREAYETLELACAITTSDYNTLWLAWKSNHDVYGCRQ
jgi:hypothetical protein